MLDVMDIYKAFLDITEIYQKYIESRKISFEHIGIDPGKDVHYQRIYEEMLETIGTNKTGFDTIALTNRILDILDEQLRCHCMGYIHIKLDDDSKIRKPIEYRLRVLKHQGDPIGFIREGIKDGLFKFGIPKEYLDYPKIDCKGCMERMKYYMTKRDKLIYDIIRVYEDHVKTMNYVLHSSVYDHGTAYMITGSDYQYMMNNINDILPGENDPMPDITDLAWECTSIYRKLLKDNDYSLDLHDASILDERVSSKLFHYYSDIDKRKKEENDTISNDSKSSESNNDTNENSKDEDSVNKSSSKNNSTNEEMYDKPGVTETGKIADRVVLTVFCKFAIDHSISEILTTHKTYGCDGIYTAYCISDSARDALIRQVKICYDKYQKDIQFSTNDIFKLNNAVLQIIDDFIWILYKTPVEVFRLKGEIFTYKNTLELYGMVVFALQDSGVLTKVEGSIIVNTTNWEVYYNNEKYQPLYFTLNHIGTIGNHNEKHKEETESMNVTSNDFSAFSLNIPYKLIIQTSCNPLNAKENRILYSREIEDNLDITPYMLAVKDTITHYVDKITSGDICTEVTVHEKDFDILFKSKDDSAILLAQKEALINQVTDNSFTLDVVTYKKKEVPYAIKVYMIVGKSGHMKDE